MRAGHTAKRLTGRAMPRPATATTPTTGVAAGAVALDAVRSAATTIAAARPSGSTRTPLTRSPDARSTRRPQPAPMAASRMGNRTHETARDKDTTLQLWAAMRAQSASTPGLRPAFRCTNAVGDSSQLHVMKRRAMLAVVIALGGRTYAGLDGLSIEKPPRLRGFSEVDGDGGNRTHVRDRVWMASTSVAGALDLIPRAPRRRGCGGPAF